MDQTSNSKEQKEEKLEFLKREEIRTMQKDIARLREKEAQKERERIATLKPEGKKKEEEFQVIPPAEKEAEAPTKREVLDTLVPAPPKKPSPFQKILVRAIVVVLLFFVLGFFYWFLAVKEEGVSPEEEITAEEEIEEEIAEEEEIIEEPEIVIPPINERILGWGHYTPTATRTIDTIIIHSAYNAIGGDLHDMEKVIEEFRMYGVTSHSLITRNGTIYRLAPDEAVAYHAGAGRMPDGSRVNIINNFSIGIELIYTTTESPNEAQYQVLAQLVKYLQQEYNIPSENILGQNEIAPERKTDPWNFDWEYFRPLLEQ